MGDFDVERGLEYFERMRSSIASTYENEYGYDHDRAMDVATRVAIKLLVRNVGPDNANLVLEEARRRKIIE